MNWVDYCILAVLAVSMLVGLLRGFTREALNLTAWVVAFAAALLLAPPFERLLRSWIAMDTVRMIVAYVSVFIIALLIGAIVTHIVSNAIRRTPFSGPDRVLGAGFGVGRGLVLVIAAVMIGGLTVVTEEQWWQESRLIKRAEPMALWARSQLPDAWLDEIAPESSSNAQAGAIPPAGAVPAGQTGGPITE